MLAEILFVEEPFYFNQYLEKYLSIVCDPYDGKGEKHHILPVCMYPQYSKETWNIVNLSYKNHYIAHELLPYLVTGEAHYKLLCAWNQMCGRTQKKFICADRYAELKEMFSINNPSKNPSVKAVKLKKQKEFWSNPENRAKHSGKNHHRYGKTISEEHKEKLRQSKLGKPGKNRGVKKPDSVSENLKGAKNPMARGVEINGVEYPTLTAAGEALGVTKHVIRYMIKTGKARDLKEDKAREWSDGRKSKISIDGVEFKTMLDASKFYGVTYTTLRNWLKTGKAKKT